MRKSFRVLFLIILSVSTCGFCFGQIEIQNAGVPYQMKINETTPITDKATGNKISYQDFVRMTKEDRRAYSLEPVINEYGQPGAYELRRVTKEEYETGQITNLDLTKRPKPGETLPLVVLKGMDGQEYRSTDLKGRVIVLGFWMTFKRPFWDAGRAKEFENILKPYGSSIATFGILECSKQEVSEAMAVGSLPFTPIPDSYGFHKKFVITTIPSFIVVDKEGKVVAYIEGTEVNELKKALISTSE